MFKIPRRNLGVRTFANGICIKTSTKLLVQDTGGDVWRGALALAKYLPADEPGSIQDKKVLELASGTGILGLSLILAGASHVTMSDKHNMTELILANAESNADILPFGRATVAPLDFSAPTMDERVLDAGPFDTIVVSDVFYDEEIVIPFINTLRRLCTMSSSSAREESSTFPPIYLAASHRSERLEELFFSHARVYFAWEDVGEKSSIRSELRREMISIWRLRVKEGVSASLLSEGLDDRGIPLHVDTVVDCDAVVGHDTKVQAGVNCGAGHKVPDSTLGGEVGLESSTRDARCPIGRSSNVIGTDNVTVNVPFPDTARSQGMDLNPPSVPQHRARERKWTVDLEELD